MIIERLLHTKPAQYYVNGKKLLSDPHYINGESKNILELTKKPSRTEVINFLLSLNKEDATYLEIGVRNPSDNFNKIDAKTKYSVDPGVEFESNPVDFKMTSDEFFQKLSKNEILSNDIKFDAIFIDGLHLAEQVDKDIKNALNFIKEYGFIVLHDCNPPTEWHARECFSFLHTPAGGSWNGTTWKAFFKARLNPSLKSCCIDTDWGVGILCKSHPIGNNTEATNPFFEYQVLEDNRKEHLNLIDFETLKETLETYK